MPLISPLMSVPHGQRCLYCTNLAGNVACPNLLNDSSKDNMTYQICKEYVDQIYSVHGSCFLFTPEEISLMTFKKLLTLR